jgi:hypothetical protein
MGIFSVRRAGLLAGMGLVISLAACAATDPQPALTAVNRHLLGRLCTDLLALPDVTAYGERRKPFEDALVRIGVFQRLGETTVAGNRKRATLYNVSPSHVRDLRIEHRDPKSKSEVARVCFGEATATRIIGTYDPQRQNVPIEFAYWVHLRPWTAALPSDFRLPRDGIAHAKYWYMTSNGAYGAEWFSHSDGPDMRAIMWPFTGKPWYIGPYPAKLRWPGQKLIV